MQGIVGIDVNGNILRLAFSHRIFLQRYVDGTADGHRAFVEHAEVIPSSCNGANVRRAFPQGLESNLLIDAVGSIVFFIIPRLLVSVNEKLRDWRFPNNRGENV